jgi:hypothetical protein
MADIAAAYAVLTPEYGVGLNGTLDATLWRLAAEVRELLAGDRPRAMIEALSRALWTAGTLGAADWQAILAAVTA